MTTQELAAVLELFPVLRSLPTGDRAALEQRCAVRALPPGTVYLREGDSCAGIALVLAGRIRVSKHSATGREITLYHIAPGQTCILTASCLLALSHYPAVATVVEETTALVVPADLFRHWVATSEPVRAFVIGHFGERLAAVMLLVEEVAFRRVDRRAAAWLGAEARGRSGHVVEMSHEDIAAHLGTARVVVSRVMEQFEARGWVVLGRRRVEVRDPAALLAYGNQSD